MYRPYIILNRCDNTPGCPVIEACPQDIFHYDFEVNKLLLNDNKCLECSLCVIECEHEAVELLTNEKIRDKKYKEEQYGMALADRLKEHYGIEPTSILDDKEIKEINNLSDINEFDNVLLYIYGNWLGESYIGYSFLKEIKHELEDEIDDLVVYKADYLDIDIDFTDIPVYLVIKKGQIKKEFNGIKNPMYFVPVLIEEYKKDAHE